MTEHRAEDLDGERLASILLSLPITSNGLRHTSLQSSLGYMNPAEEVPELEYIRDCLTLGTREIIDKWFGGSMVAGRAMADLRDAHLRTMLSAGPGA